ncbi:MAG: hypothetical protein M1826_002916 [Phylliscum demangeonii]|nr:MAG: hypothetical protein M1826_002916 [Phylliscum demangeonii]
MRRGGKSTGVQKAELVRIMRRYGSSRSICQGAAPNEQPEPAEDADPARGDEHRLPERLGPDPPLYTWGKTLMPTSFGAAPRQMDLLDQYRRMILTGSAFCTPVDLPPRRILAPKMARVVC